MVTAEVVAANLGAVERRIEQAGGDPESIADPRGDQDLRRRLRRGGLDAGLRDLGENYAAELVAKAAALDGPDVRLALPRRHPDEQGGSARSGDRLLRRAWPATKEARGHRHGVGPGAAVMVQVELTGPAGSQRVPPEEVAGLVAQARDLGLDVRG